MLRTMLKSKIHRATVTHVDVQRAGSITVDEDLLDAADLLPGERVTIVDVTNGGRLETYVVPGERGSGVIGVNGAVAHLVGRGDLLVMISYATMEDERARSFRPKIVSVDAGNRPVDLGTDAGAIAAGAQPADRSCPAPVSETDDAARLDALIQAEA